MTHEMSFEHTRPRPNPLHLFDEAADLNDSPVRLFSTEIFPSDPTDRDASDRTDMQLGAPPGVSHKKPHPAHRADMWGDGSSKGLSVDDLYHEPGSAPNGPCKKQLQRPETWMADPGKHFSFEDEGTPTRAGEGGGSAEKERFLSAEKTRSVNGRPSLGESVGSTNSSIGHLDVRSLHFGLESPENPHTAHTSPKPRGTESLDSPEHTHAHKSLKAHDLQSPEHRAVTRTPPLRKLLESPVENPSEASFGSGGRAPGRRELLESPEALDPSIETAPGADAFNSFNSGNEGNSVSSATPPSGGGVRGSPVDSLPMRGQRPARLEIDDLSCRTSELFMGEHISPNTPRTSPPQGLDRTRSGGLLWSRSPKRSSPTRGMAGEPLSMGVMHEHENEEIDMSTEDGPHDFQRPMFMRDEDVRVEMDGDCIYEPCTPLGETITPQGNMTTDLFFGGTPPSFSPRKPSNGSNDWMPSRMVRKNSLMDRKDYTKLILKRMPSQLLYDRHYTLTELLGRGDFGEVWTAVNNRTNEKFALKKSTRRFRGHAARQKYVKEITNVAQMGHHPNLVHYERAWQDDGHFFIVMELCTGGTLNKLIQGLQGPMALGDTRNYAKGLLRGLARLHSQGLLHLDLKPDNLFLMPDGGVKIGDFGLCLPATEWDEEEGDREYLAPEILQNVASPAADIFSAGLVMYQMLFGVKRLPGQGPEWIAIRSGAPLPPPPAPEGYESASQPAQAFASLVQSMLKIAPAERPSAETLLATHLAWADEPPANEELDGSKSCGKKRVFTSFKLRET